MKVLFVASNPANESGLGLEAEITALQATFSNVQGEPVEFIPQPGVIIETLAPLIRHHQPDVLHVTAHGSGEQLAMRNGAGDKCQITAEILGGLLGNHRPKLIYLNACNSFDVARGLIDHTDITISSSAPIINRAATTGALNFYSSIVQGETAGTAFGKAEKSVAAMQDKPVLKIEPAHGIQPNDVVLHRVPELVAEFTQENLLNRDIWKIRLGVIGCPTDTIQVVFFLDDAEYIRNPDKDPALTLCSVSRVSPLHGAVWMYRGFHWEADEDMRVFATGVRANGKTYSLSSTLTKALKRHERWLDPERRSIARVIVERIAANQFLANP